MKSNTRIKYLSNDGSYKEVYSPDNPQTLGGYLPLTGGTVSGNINVKSSGNEDTDIRYFNAQNALNVTTAYIGTNGHISGAWLRTTADVHLGSAATAIAVIDSGWICSRTPAEILSDIGAASAAALENLNNSALKSVPLATNSVVGGFKTGYSSSDKSYAVQLSSDGKAFVSVPWTDNNTTYTLSLNNATLSLTPSSGSVQTVKLKTLDQPDDRVVAINPSTLPVGFSSLGLKSSSTTGLSGYAGVISVKQWSDNSGGNMNILAFTNAGIYKGLADPKATSFTGPWSKLIEQTDLDSAIGDFVTKTGGSISEPEEITGIKDFSNGFKMGDATIAYNATTSSLEVSFA